MKSKPFSSVSIRHAAQWRVHCVVITFAFVCKTYCIASVADPRGCEGFGRRIPLCQNVFVMWMHKRGRLACVACCTVHAVVVPLKQYFYLLPYYHFTAGVMFYWDEGVRTPTFWSGVPPYRPPVFESIKCEILHSVFQIFRVPETR